MLNGGPKFIVATFLFMEYLQGVLKVKNSRIFRTVAVNTKDIQNNVLYIRRQRDVFNLQKLSSNDEESDIG